MKKDQQTPDFDSNDLDILSILEEIQRSTADFSESVKPNEIAKTEIKEEEKPAGTTLPTSPTAENIDPMVFLRMLQVGDSLPPDEEDATSAPSSPTRKKFRFRKPKKPTAETASPATVDDAAPNTPADSGARSRLRSALCGILPQKGDAVSEIVRKGVFLVSLLAFLVSSSFLLYYMVLEPQSVNNHAAHYVKLYEDTATNQEEKNGYNYPAGMQPAFRQLYDINSDIAGWLSYVSTDNTSFLDIRQPVVHCDNNDTYLNHAFDGSKSRSGTLFFDKRNTFTKGASNRVSIIYGHNMASGLMFAKLNKLIGNMYYARCASLIHLNTLYEDRQYKVFAVVMCDEGASKEQYFSYLRTVFADDSDFLNYVQELRARSLFDYPVDVNEDDELLILSTCTAKSQAKVNDGRLAVIARRVRADETAEMNTVEIVENKDVIMPYAWYTAQNLTPHDFYTQADYHIPEDSRTTTIGQTTATTAETTASDQTTTSAQNRITTTRAPGTVNRNTNRTTTTTTATATTTTTAATTATTAAETASADQSTHPTDTTEGTNT